MGSVDKFSMLNNLVICWLGLQSGLDLLISGTSVCWNPEGNLDLLFRHYGNPSLHVADTLAAD